MVLVSSIFSVWTTHNRKEIGMIGILQFYSSILWDFSSIQCIKSVFWVKYLFRYSVLLILLLKNAKLTYERSLNYGDLIVKLNTKCFLVFQAMEFKSTTGINNPHRSKSYEVSYCCSMFLFSKKKLSNVFS